MLPVHHGRFSTEEGHSVLVDPLGDGLVPHGLMPQAGPLLADGGSLGQGYGAGELEGACVLPLAPDLPVQPVHVGEEQYPVPGLVGQDILVYGQAHVLGPEVYTELLSFLSHIHAGCDGLAVDLGRHHFHVRFLHEGGQAAVDLCLGAQRTIHGRTKSPQPFGDGQFSIRGHLDEDKAGRYGRGRGGRGGDFRPESHCCRAEQPEGAV